MATRTKHLRAVTTTDEAPTELDASYPEKFLDCRDLRHPWQRVGSYHLSGDIIRVLHCPRCGTDRRDKWAPSGYRRPSTYDYPDGYRIGDGGASALDVRQEVLRRFVVYESEDDMNAALLKSRRRRKAAS